MEHPLHRLRFRLDHRWAPRHASPSLDGDLSPARRARLQRHLDECPECRALLRELAALVAALGALHDGDGVPVAKTIFSSLRGRIDEPSRDRP